MTWGEGLTPPASIPGAKGDIPCYDWAAFLALTTDGPADALTARQAEMQPGHWSARAPLSRDPRPLVPLPAPPYPGVRPHSAVVGPWFGDMAGLF